MIICVFFRFLNRTPISRGGDCYGLVEISEISGGRQVFGLRQRFDPFLAWRAGTNSWYSTGRESAHKSTALENHSSLGDYMYEIQHISKEENMLNRDLRGVSNCRFRRA